VRGVAGRGWEVYPQALSWPAVNMRRAAQQPQQGHSRQQLVSLQLRCPKQRQLGLWERCSPAAQQPRQRPGCSAGAHTHHPPTRAGTSGGRRPGHQSLRCGCPLDVSPRGHALRRVCCAEGRGASARSVKPGAGSSCWEQAAAQVRVEPGTAQSKLATTAPSRSPPAAPRCSIPVGWPGGRWSHRRTPACAHAPPCPAHFAQNNRPVSQKGAGAQQAQAAHFAAAAQWAPAPMGRGHSQQQQQLRPQPASQHCNAMECNTVQ
jgi:hypothetical protein